MNSKDEAVLVGYLPRRTYRKPPFLRSATVEEICCVIDHMIHVIELPNPVHWYHQNRHNALGYFDTEEIAWTALRDEIFIRLERDDSKDPPWRSEITRLPTREFDLYAYKMLPLLYAKGNQQDFSFSKPAAVPLVPNYERLGYDTVGWSDSANFVCSPLLCNVEAANGPVNRHCLFDAMEPALELARRYSAGEWQPVRPGSGHCTAEAYCVVEVWRKAKPFPEPPRCREKFEWSPELLRNLVAHTIAHGRVFER